MEKSKLVNVIKKISIGFAVFFAVLFVIGIVSLFYNSYKCTRVPIYQTTMTDFELVVQPEGRTDGSRSEEQHNLQNLIDKFEIITLQCFVFQGHPQRPSYCILLVGTLPTDADFSEYSLEKHPLKSGERVFSALKLCGADPKENEEYLELRDYFFDYWVYIYHNQIIFETWANNPTYLLRDEQKREFLGKYIVPREKEAVENATPYAPQKYVYLETGFGGPTEQIVIDLENEKITYEFSSTGFRLSDVGYWKQELPLEMSKEIIASLAGFTAENWEDQYVDSRVADGTQWKLEIVSADGSTRKISGSNAWPKDFPRLCIKEIREKAKANQ